MNSHEQLRKKLDLFPVGFPRQEETMRMLELLFSAEEARIASFLPMPPMMLPAGSVARKAGVEKSEAKELLDGLVGRGLIMGNNTPAGTLYTMLPAYPGFIEMQFMQGVEQDEKRIEAGKLWHEAYRGEFGHEAYGFPSSGMRVVPIKKSIDATQRVFSYEGMEKLIRDSGSIAITDCACRKTAMKCDKPLDVCMLFGPLALYTADKGLSTKVTRSEAVKALKRAEDANLIHMTTNCKPPVSIVCNCCECCCSSLKGVTMLNKPASSVASNFVCAVQDADACKLCKKCVKSCPMEALSLVEKAISVEEEKCIGCGICVSNCPAESITLKRVGDKKPFPSSLHLMAKVIEERGKLPAILQQIPKDLL